MDKNFLQDTAATQKIASKDQILLKVKEILNIALIQSSLIKLKAIKIKYKNVLSAPSANVHHRK